MQQIKQLQERKQFLESIKLDRQIFQNIYFDSGKQVPNKDAASNEVSQNAASYQQQQQ